MAKVIGVAMYLGGMTAAVAIVCCVSPESAGQWTQLADTLRAVFVFAAVPGLLVAIVCGVVLSRMHGGVLWRMRWLRVKMAVLVVAVPVLHLWVSGIVAEIRTAAMSDTPDTLDAASLDGHLQMLRLALILATVITAAVVVLGRHKPRLGQPIQTLAQQRAAAAATDEPAQEA